MPRRRKHLTPLSELVEKAARESARDEQRIAPQCLPPRDVLQARMQDERLGVLLSNPGVYFSRFPNCEMDQNDPRFREIFDAMEIEE